MSGSAVVSQPSPPVARRFPEPGNRVARHHKRRCTLEASESNQFTKCLEHIASAKIMHKPFPHCMLNTFVNHALFAELNSRWPSELLSPTPGEIQSAFPRRRHLWLSNTFDLNQFPPCWADFQTFVQSDSLCSALTYLARRLGGTPNHNLRCESRLCEETLPYMLARHRDRPKKILSLVWLFTQDPDCSLGTTLYGSAGEKLITKLPANGALCILNSDDSLHGGEWLDTFSNTRKSVHIFLTE
jgi:hypothetical protein